MKYKQIRLIATLGLISCLIIVVGLLLVLFEKGSSIIDENGNDFETILNRIQNLESIIWKQNESINNYHDQLIQEKQDPKEQVAEDLNKKIIEPVDSNILLKKEVNTNENDTVVLPIIIFSCNRPGVRRCLERILKYRPNPKKFPVIVSQDCADKATAEIIKSFSSQITYIQQPDQREPNYPYDQEDHVGHFKVARHYLYGLRYVFRTMKHNAVIVVEDDLDISPDFFSYFSSTYDLMLRDPSIWCISAWNDNGKDSLIDVEKGEKTLYRSDFFPGLGWMTTRKIWNELENKWPKCFWDDWMRLSTQRHGRVCIRPEISRTRTFGKIGVSNGQNYDDHLKFIKLNDKPVDFSQLNLSYLIKSEYDKTFLNMINSLPIVTGQDVLSKTSRSLNGSVRILYKSVNAFEKVAKLFGIMQDFRADTPRTGYYGIVTFYYCGTRVFLVPE